MSIGGDSGFPYPDPSLGFIEADDDTGPTHVGIVDLGSGLGFDDGGLENYVCETRIQVLPFFGTRCSCRRLVPEGSISSGKRCMTREKR